MNQIRTRSWRTLGSAILGLGAVLLLVFLTHSARASTAPNVAHSYQPETTASTLTIASGTHTIYLPLVMVGENTFSPFGLQFYGSLQSSQTITLAVEAGVRWIRMPLDWSAIEITNTIPENYNWAPLDTSVTSAQARNIHLILTISSQPDWAAQYPMGPLTDTVDLIEFAGALVERYDGDGIDDAPGSPRVNYFELYNEPDNTDPANAESGGWGFWGYNGAGYAELLREIYPAVKTANSNAKLVMGGLALDWFVDQGGIFDRYFLDDVLAACQGQMCFDMMNFHYYPFFQENWNSYGKGIIGKTNYIRQKLNTYGFQDTPIICTETSWASGSIWGSDELQSRHAVKGFARGMAVDLPAIIWYKTDDYGDDSLPGLLDENLIPKSSFYAYQTAAAMLSGVSYERALTLGETQSAQIEGYVFDKEGLRIDVIWTNDATPFNASDDPQLPFSANVSLLRVVDKFGNETWLNDASDGTRDGKVTLTVEGSPLFLEYYP